MMSEVNTEQSNTASRRGPEASTLGRLGGVKAGAVDMAYRLRRYTDSPHAISAATSDLSWRLAPDLHERCDAGQCHGGNRFPSVAVLSVPLTADWAH